MKLYKVKHGLVIEHDGKMYSLKGEQWDSFVNDDRLADKMREIIEHSKPDSNAGALVDQQLLAPIQSQEVWASGVTYLRSKVERQEESKQAGGGEFYARVYEAERPELFFKATAYRTVGHKGEVRIREDSTWNVPEPELTLVINSNGKIVGYTIGNDMSSRSIEGENPLYLPQAKTYDGCCALGPCVYVTETPLPGSTVIELKIRRKGAVVVSGEITLDQMKRTQEELVRFLFRECSFPHGCLLMTGTGIIPSNDFTLARGDEISITIEPIGTLVNTVG
ncbi:MAG: fumarylacetoacetate hydrolase family protein [Ignavibacteriae bacterium]|nr:fumarylacetoacetate hydrolase family protein [Ignavibacteriota bacterium]